MTRPLSRGRAGTAVVPAGWGEGHAPTLARSYTARVSLTRPTGDGWDPATETSGGDTPEPYASNIAASIYALPTNGDRSVSAGEETLTTTDYVLGVDHDLAELHNGDLIVVDDAPGDLLLVGRTLRVDRFDLGAERFERNVYATLQDQPAQVAP